MVITDHDSYKAYTYWESLPEKPDFVVLRGIEYDTIDGGHILIVMPTGVRPHILDLRGMPVSFLIDVVHHYGGICGPAHPYGSKFMSLMNTWYGKKHHNIMKRFDFLESFNACESGTSNAQAGALALLYGLPGTGGSDSHRRNCAGFGYTEIEDDICTEDDLIAYLKAKKPTHADGQFYTHTTKQKIGPINEVLVYSFWFYNKLFGHAKGIRRHHEMRKTGLQHKITLMRHYIDVKN